MLRSCNQRFGAIFIHFVFFSFIFLHFFKLVVYHVCQILQHILLDMPSLAFFTTYALLVLFWAEIYYQVVFNYPIVASVEQLMSHLLNCLWSLVWFCCWHEYWQARAVSTDGLRPSFYTINAVVYAVQVKIRLHTCTSCTGKRKFWIGSLTCKSIAMFIQSIL